MVIGKLIYIDLYRAPEYLFRGYTFHFHDF